MQFCYQPLKTLSMLPKILCYCHFTAFCLGVQGSQGVCRYKTGSCGCFRTCRVSHELRLFPGLPVCLWMSESSWEEPLVCGWGAIWSYQTHGMSRISWWQEARENAKWSYNLVASGQLKLFICFYSVANIHPVTISMSRACSSQLQTS